MIALLVGHIYFPYQAEIHAEGNHMSINNNLNKTILEVRGLTKAFYGNVVLDQSISTCPMVRCWVWSEKTVLEKVLW